jgi:hypothetical protein
MSFMCYLNIFLCYLKNLLKKFENKLNPFHRFEKKIFDVNNSLDNLSALAFIFISLKIRKFEKLMFASNFKHFPFNASNLFQIYQLVHKGKII